VLLSHRAVVGFAGRAMTGAHKGASTLQRRRRQSKTLPGPGYQITIRSKAPCVSGFHFCRCYGYSHEVSTLAIQRLITMFPSMSIGAPPCRSMYATGRPLCLWTRRQCRFGYVLDHVALVLRPHSIAYQELGKIASIGDLASDANHLGSLGL
jgi:hypothetical protein